MCPVYGSAEFEDRSRGIVGFSNKKPKNGKASKHIFHELLQTAKSEVSVAFSFVSASLNRLDLFRTLYLYLFLFRLDASVIRGRNKSSPLSHCLESH